MIKELFENSVTRTTLYSSADLFDLSSILSALDAENELLVQEALERLMDGIAFV